MSRWFTHRKNQHQTSCQLVLGYPGTIDRWINTCNTQPVPLFLFEGATHCLMPSINVPWQNNCTLKITNCITRIIMLGYGSSLTLPPTITEVGNGFPQDFFPLQQGYRLFSTSIILWRKGNSHHWYIDTLGRFFMSVFQHQEVGIACFACFACFDRPGRGWRCFSTQKQMNMFQVAAGGRSRLERFLKNMTEW